MCFALGLAIVLPAPRVRFNDRPLLDHDLRAVRVERLWLDGHLRHLRLLLLLLLPDNQVGWGEVGQLVELAVRF